MKKAKVLLITNSPKLEDGSRKIVNQQVICTCGEKGDADLICYLLKNNAYKNLIENYTDKTQMFCLVVGY